MTPPAPRPQDTLAERLYCAYYDSIFGHDDHRPLSARMGWVRDAWRAVATEAETEVAALRAQVTTLRELLRDYEWLPDYSPGGEGDPSCRVCSRAKHKDHALGCRMAAALWELRDKPEEET